MRVLRGIDRRVAAAGAIAVAGLAGCGGGGPKSQDANEPGGDYSIEVVRASFPTQQRLAERSQMQIAVRNAGDKTVPNVAVTVEPGGPNPGPGAAAFAQTSADQRLANPSRPIWILDAGPPGGITAYTNTWALGPLRPGQSKTFVWRVTAVKAGSHTVKYTVAAGLDGKAKAQLPGGDGPPTGEIQVNISSRPADARIGAGDQPVVSPR